MANLQNDRGICDKSLLLQMSRKSRLINYRHPYLSELDSRFYASLDFINLQPKNIFSIDIFPNFNVGLKSTLFKNANWVDGSSLLNKPKSFAKKNFFLDILENLNFLNKKKEIFYPSKNYRYAFSDNAFDYVEALSVIPWANNPVLLINEIYRLLDYGGFFGFTSFGPNTLDTLIATLSKENKSQVRKSFLPLIDLHDIGDFCTSVGFVSPVVASNRVCFKYNNAETALNELRLLYGNPRSDRDGFLRGKSWHKKIINALNNCKDSDGFVTLEFEFIYGHAWKGEKKSSKIKDGSEFVEKKVIYINESK